MKTENSSCETDPYGKLDYTMGNDEDFICFDWCYNSETGRMVIHSVVNSETGGFIQDFMKTECYPPDAVQVATRHVEAAWEWLADNDVDISGEHFGETEANGREFIGNISRAFIIDTDGPVK